MEEGRKGLAKAQYQSFVLFLPGNVAIYGDNLDFPDLENPSALHRQCLGMLQDILFCTGQILLRGCLCPKCQPIQPRPRNLVLENKQESRKKNTVGRLVRQGSEEKVTLSLG